MLCKMEKLKKILVITDTQSTVSTLAGFLAEKFEVVSCEGLDLESFADDHVPFEYILADFVFLSDFRSDCDDDFYKDQLAKIQSHYPGIRVLILSDQRKIERAGELLKLGYHNIIQLPVTKDVLEHRLLVEQERELLAELKLETAAEVVPHKNLFQTNNKSFGELLEQLERVAPTRSTILITGESGTGKSLLAKSIHQKSGRENQAFVEVHCGAIPESLVESELFGHEKGSFTGALKRKIGKFELANKGSIFLDEIGTIGPAVQVRLLQVIQERFVSRVGGESVIPLDIRIIAATNSDLKQSVSAGTFREDLYYRLNVFQIEIPPLRERKEDIPDLCKNLLEKFNLLYGKNISNVSSEVLDIFHSYNWPGNVRELENVLERAYVLEVGNKIRVENLSKELLSADREMVNLSPLVTKGLGLIEARKEATEAFEKKYITDLLIAYHGKVSAMANEAKVSVRQIHKLLAKHNIKAKEFSIKLRGTEQELNAL